MEQIVLVLQVAGYKKQLNKFSECLQLKQYDNFFSCSVDSDDKSNYIFKAEKLPKKRM